MDTEMEIKEFADSSRASRRMLICKVTKGQYASEISDFAHASALPGYLGYDWADVLFYPTRGKRVFYCSCVANERTMLN